MHLPSAFISADCAREEAAQTRAQALAAGDVFAIVMHWHSNAMRAPEVQIKRRSFAIFPLESFERSIRLVRRIKMIPSRVNVSASAR